MPTNQETCFSQGRGYDPTSGLCVTRQENRDGSQSTVYYAPGQSASTTPPNPDSNPAQFIFYAAGGVPTGTIGVSPPPTGIDPGERFPVTDAGGIGAFLSSPSPLGVSWGVVGIGVVIAIFVFSSSGGTGSKKSAGWI